MFAVTKCELRTTQLKVIFFWPQVYITTFLDSGKVCLGYMSLSALVLNLSGKIALMTEYFITGEQVGSLGQDSSL